MTGNVRVVEDGVETVSDSRSPPGPNWFWLIVGFVIGLSLAVVFFTAPSEEPLETAQTVPASELSRSAISDSEAPPFAQAQPEGIAEVVAGFPDTLIALTQIDDSSLGQLTWPVAGPPTVEQLAGSSITSADFDVSGRMLAIGAGGRDTGGMVLSLGSARRIQPIASDVTGFAWHESRSGLLAFSQVTGGEWLLSTVGTSRTPELVSQGPDRGGHIVGWGDWGFAIQEGEEVALLSEDGQRTQVLEGRVLDTDDSGRILLYDGELRLVGISGSAQALDVDLSGIGDPEVAAFSPDRSKLAVVGDAGHLIFPFDGAGDVMYAPLTPGFPQLGWSSDSRFLVYPWVRGVLLVDTERSGAQPLAELTQHTVVAVTAVPAGDG